MKRLRAVRLAVRSLLSRHAIESLEARRLFTAAAWPLSGGNPLRQNWESVNFTTANDWSVVPSFEGYAFAGTSNDVNPGTLVANTAGTANIGVFTIQNPDTSTTAGNQEFEFTNATQIIGTRAGGTTTTTGLRTVAFQGSGGATGTPFIKAYVDTTQLLPSHTVRVKYDLIDIDAGAATAPQQVALQYRTNSGSTWTNVPSGYVAVAGPNDATKGTATFVSALLPSDSVGKTGLEIRIITANAGGNDQFIAVENIDISVARIDGYPGFFTLDQGPFSLNEGVGTYVARISRNTGFQGAVSLDYTFSSTPPSGATYGVDYTTLPAGAGPHTVTFANGQTFVDVPITITQDNIDEFNESFLLTISNATNGGEIYPGIFNTTQYTIVDDDDGGTLALASTTLSTTEAAGVYNVVVNRSGGSSGPATVAYLLSNGSATSPADYNGLDGSLSGTVNFADGQTAATIAVSIVQDSTVETNETFTVALSNASGATLGSPGTATVTIVDDDLAGSFAFNPATATVGESNGNVTLNVIRSGGTSGPVTLTYVTTNGSAIDGSDFTGTQTGTVNFASGAATGTITIPILNDTTGEGIESFTVTLTGGGTIGAANVATVTITDDDVVGDPGVVSFTSTVVGSSEINSTVTLQLVRTDGSAGAILVPYTTTDGTAISPDDYAGTQSGVVSFANGMTTAQIVISIVGETTPEANESFTLTLGTPTGGATVGTNATTTVYIVDDDTPIPSGLYVNEVFVDPPGQNPPKQFIEIKGTPGTFLNNVFVVELEGDFEQNPGQIDFAIDLSGYTIGSNGLLLITALTNGWDTTTPPVDAATTIVKTALLDATTTGLEFASYSVALMFRNPAAPNVLTIGTDLDSNNLKDAGGAGNLESLLPSSLTVLDSVGTTDNGVNDVRYGTVLPALTAGGAADAIVRITNALNDPFAFYYGTIAGNSGNTTLTFNAAANQRSTNFPVGVGIVTPGAINAGVLPQVLSTVFDPQAGQKVVVTFSEDVGASIAAGDFSLTLNAPSPVSVSLVVSSISPDGKTVTLTFANTGGALPNVLLDGTYTFTTKANQIASTGTGALLPSDVVKTFKFLNADFNVNGSVGFEDLVSLAQNYGLASGATFAQGDANYDAKVDFADLVILAQRYGSIAQLAAMFAPPAPTPAPTKGVTRKTDEAGVVPTVAATPTTKASLGTKTAIR